MEIQTKVMGTVDVPDSNMLTIPEGLFGFEEYTEFALIESGCVPFYWLQSAENADLAFIIVDPFLICPEYETDIDDDVLARIGISAPEDIVVMTIVTVPRDGSPVTANFQGPLVINRSNGKCMQVILSDSRWTTKVDIAASLKSGRGRAKC